MTEYVYQNVIRYTAKRHTKRKGTNYHKRIQKKWDKRVLKDPTCKLAIQEVTVMRLSKKVYDKLMAVSNKFKSN